MAWAQSVIAFYVFRGVIWPHIFDNSQSCNIVVSDVIIIQLKFGASRNTHQFNSDNLLTFLKDLVNYYVVGLICGNQNKFTFFYENFPIYLQSPKIALLAHKSSFFVYPVWNTPTIFKVFKFVEIMDYLTCMMKNEIIEMSFGSVMTC